MKKSHKIIIGSAFVVSLMFSLFIFADTPAEKSKEIIIVNVEGAKEIGRHVFTDAVITIQYAPDRREENRMKHDEVDKNVIATIQKLSAAGYSVISESSYPSISGDGSFMQSSDHQTWVLQK